MADFNNTNLADFSGVWVFCEQRQGKMMPTTFELISEGRKLADELGVELGGILLGVIEQLSKTYISTLWADAIVFGVLVVVLVVKPTGLLGKKISEKV